MVLSPWLDNSNSDVLELKQKNLDIHLIKKKCGGGHDQVDDLASRLTPKFRRCLISAETNLHDFDFFFSGLGWEDQVMTTTTTFFFGFKI